MDSTEQKPVSDVSLRTTLTYTMGGVGRDMTYSLYANFIITFILFTKSLTEAQFSVISIILIVCRIWDAITDPVMGGIIEGTRTRFGKFKPWILIGAIISATILILVFALPIKDWVFVGVFGFLAFMWSMMFGVNDISYWSMLPSLSSNPDTRSKLTALANLFAGLGGVIVVALVPVLTAGDNTIGGNAITAYAVISIAVAAVFLGCTLMTVLGVQEKPLQPEEKKPIGLKRTMKVIFNNDQLLWTALVMLLYNLGSTLILAFGTIYVYFEFGYNGTLVLFVTAAYAAGAVFVNIFYPQIAAKINRKNQQFISIITIMIGYALIFIMSFFNVGMVPLCIGVAILSFGQSLFYMMLTINISNTVEYNEWKTGAREEGIIFSIRPFMAKMGSALQQLFILIVYLAAGITAITTKISDIENLASSGEINAAEKASRIGDALKGVTSNNKLVLTICMTFIPALLLLASYIIVKTKFKIDEDFYKKIVAETEKRKVEAEAAEE